LTFSSVWTRHIADSAQLIALAPQAKRWVDMGSGAGFPGLVIAIQLADVPGAIVHCIESDGRKCAFLREAARATGAAAIIHPVRVEAIEPESLGTVDAVTARAFAPLPLTLKLARPWMERGAIAVFPRGESANDQIAASPEAWTHAIESLQSVVNPKAAILRIRQG
jgi:16S rRNA (guanine527-N7)-methyltransferase